MPIMQNNGDCESLLRVSCMNGGCQTHRTEPVFTHYCENFSYQSNYSKVVQEWTGQSQNENGFPLRLDKAWEGLVFYKWDDQHRPCLRQKKAFKAKLV